MNRFPDYPQLEQIRRRLWEGRGYGQAAVMIGAGFSRFAKPRYPNPPIFPLWDELARGLFDDLNPRAGVSADEYELKAKIACANSGVLRLAYEYETAFGRSVMDRRVAQSIPDSDYLPGELHRLLLSLPWSDVYTTNYDTLLERAREDVHERKYDLVVRFQDFPGQMKPRIIKLHGSLPSHLPLIITEEDYRTYPVKFAPFVNAVQQSLMENALVLLGFSGQDPNFLQWIGWVRDRLTSACPPIYLCGLLGLSSSRRRLLESLNVIPIDVAPLFPAKEYPDVSKRYSLSTKWLLLSFLEGKPADMSAWPNPAKKHQWESVGLPELPSGPEDLTSEPGPPHNASENIEEWIPILLDILRIWSLNRRKYPGWVIIPAPNRETIAFHTARWITPIKKYISGLEPLAQLQLAFELQWRLERGLIPLTVEMSEVFESVLLNGVFVNHAQEPRPQAPQQWADLAIAVLRRCREDGDARYTGWLHRIEICANLSPEQRAALAYQQCLFHAYRSEPVQLMEIVQAWDTTGTDVLWTIRRSALLVECGQMEPAVTAVEQALTTVRNAERDDQPDYILLSREAWAMWFLHVVSMASLKSRFREFWGRWAQLSAFDSNPVTLADGIESQLDNAQPLLPSVSDQTDAFTGRKRRSHNWTTTPNTARRPGFSWLRMYEEAGIPMRANDRSIAGETVVKAAKDIAPFSPWWACLAVLRTGDRKAIEKWFDKVRISTMTQSLVDTLFSTTFNTLERQFQMIAGSTRAAVVSGFDDVATVDGSLLVLRRIVFRISETQKKQLLDRVVQMSRQARGRIGGDPALFSDLFSAVVDGSTTEDVSARINDLLRIPIPGFDGFDVAPEGHWPEPASTKNWQDLRRQIVEIPALNDEAVQWLLRAIREHGGAIRQEASARLIPLAMRGALDPPIMQQLLDSLLARIDPESGLPQDVGYFAAALLEIPAFRETLEPRLRKYLNLGNIESVGSVNGSRVSVHGGVTFKFVREWLFAVRVPIPKDPFIGPIIVMDRGEIELLLGKIETWWSQSKPILLHVTGDRTWGWSDSPRVGASLIVQLIAIAVLPALSSDDVLVDRAVSVLDEMNASGVDVALAIGEIARVRLEKKKALTRQLLAGLASRDEERIANAAYGAYRWIAKTSSSDPSKPSGYLLTELVSRIASRREPGLVNVIEDVTELLRRRPELFTAKHRADLCLGLDFLLKETELPSEVIRMQAKLSDESIYELPKLAEAASTLAVTLKTIVPVAFQQPCDSVNEWGRLAVLSNLPEVRAPWMNQ